VEEMRPSGRLGGQVEEMRPSGRLGGQVEEMRPYSAVQVPTGVDRN
jgi:hypothetical protein